MWNKNKLIKQLKSFENNAVGFCISNSIFFNENKMKYLYHKNRTFKKKVFYDLIENYFISFDTVIIKKEFLKKLSHTIDERFNVIHDMDLLVRLSAICEMRYVPLPLSKWRMSMESDSFNKFKRIIQEKKIFIKKISFNKTKNNRFLASKEKFLDVLIRQEIFSHIEKKLLKSF